MRVHREDPLGVYVHIPYCVSKCPYCDFNSMAAGAPAGIDPMPGNPPFDERSYVECLLKELSAVVAKAGLEARGLASVYIGGGTPTLFSPRAIGDIIEGITAAFKPSGVVEITVEANPGTVDAQGLKGLKEAGVNRLSIGVQSFSDQVLEALGRTHSADEAEVAYALAKEAGFDNVGIDLIFGAPGQEVNRWEETLSRTVELAPEHVSLYGLTIEPSTPFGRFYGKGGKVSVLKGSERLPDEDTVVGMYTVAVRVLKGAGYEHYEISNFARKGRRSVHNSRYWQGGDYIGLGAGAHTYLAGSCRWGLRAWNERDPVKYMRSVREVCSARAGCEELTEDQAMAESVMLGLRMLDKGIEGPGFKRRFGRYPKEALSGWRDLEAQGLLTASGEDLLLTPGGVLLSDEVFVRIL